MRLRKRRRDRGAAPQARGGREGRQRFRRIGFFLAVDHARSAETITTLANAGADTSLADKSGTTPLMLAAAGDDPNLVLALSASGVEVDKPNREGLTALQVAAGQGAPAVIAALVQRGAKVDLLSANDLSPLMLAVKMNNKTNVEALLEAGANVNLSNKEGYTAIGYRPGRRGSPVVAGAACRAERAGCAYGAKRTAVLRQYVRR